MLLTELQPSDLHLWFCPLVNLDADVRGRCRAVLDDAEALRHQRFLSAEAADQFLVGRALMRRCLSFYAPVAPADWRLESNEYGKPRVAAIHDLDWLSFNVSNTRGMVACAVSRDCEIGVDVEGDTRKYEPEIARRFFTPNETAAIESVPADERPARFLRTWTLKEAVVKATGLGLSCPLSTFDVQIDATPPQVVFTERMPEDPRSWQLFRLRLESAFHAAVAVRRSGDRQLRLSVERLSLEAVGSGDA